MRTKGRSWFEQKVRTFGEAVTVLTIWYLEAERSWLREELAQAEGRLRELIGDPHSWRRVEDVPTQQPRRRGRPPARTITVRRDMPLEEWYQRRQAREPKPRIIDTTRAPQNPQQQNIESWTKIARLAHVALADNAALLAMEDAVRFSALAQAEVSRYEHCKLAIRYEHVILKRRETRQQQQRSGRLGGQKVPHDKIEFAKLLRRAYEAAGGGRGPTNQGLSVLCDPARRRKLLEAPSERPITEFKPVLRDPRPGLDPEQRSSRITAFSYEVDACPARLVSRKAIENRLSKFRNTQKRRA